MKRSGNAHTDAEMNLDHLDERVRPIARLEGPERSVRLADEHFITYDAAEAVLEELEFMIRTKDAERPQGRMLMAPTLHGKTSILAQFERSHRADDNFGGDAAVIPVVRVQYPPNASEGVFAVILDKLGVPYPAAANIRRLRKDCLDRLQQVQCKMLLIDEFHHILNGSQEQQKQGLDSIKYLYNDFKRPIVIAGTKDVFVATCKSEQMLSRFRPITLSRFPHADDDGFIDILIGFEMLTPLRKPSNLDAEEMRTQIYKMTHGTIGNIADLVLVMGREAIETGEERITLDMLTASSWKSKADPDSADEAA